jgi:hypothetical protein
MRCIPDRAGQPAEVWRWFNVQKNGNNTGCDSVYIAGKNFQYDVRVLSGYRVYINVAVGEVFHGTSASKVA